MAVQIVDGPNPDTARLFLDYLGTPEAREAFVRWRFDPLPEEPAE